MVTTIKPGWSRPAAILFASEIPVNEKAFGFALAEAAEFGADLILFHAFDSPDAASSQGSGLHCDYTRCRAERQRLEPLAQRARNLGIHCRIVVRPGLAAEQILLFLRERRIDRVVMGTHSPGPIGKLLVGSVAEAVLRNAPVPVNIVGPEVVEGAYRNFAARTILCSVGAQESSRVVASFAAELAARHHAGLILQLVIPPQDCAEALAGRTLGQIEAELPSLVPLRLLHKIGVRVRAVLGDPTEELLYQGRSQHANLIVLGAQGASHFAAISRAGIIYKVLAYAQCPVITLSPIMLAVCGVREEKPRLSELCLAGVF
ncbi:MAG: universal stress protein [Terracidiphilus sp.]|jgi:nucleotide-binding universal stress UspA family protein